MHHSEVVSFTRDQAPIQIKGRMHTLTTLQIVSASLGAIAAALSQKIAQAPAFFAHIPVVIELKTAEPLDFAGLRTMLMQHQLIPVGLIGGSATQREQAKAWGWALMPETGHTESKTESPPLPVIAASKVITEPVRSGQQVYAQGGDLIVLAPVGHGSEILADGHIHVYGPLRGRALAGIMGDTQARIFCHSLEAELVSIAGHYLVSEQIKSHGWKVAAQIMYTGTNLHIAPI